MEPIQKYNCYKKINKFFINEDDTIYDLRMRENIKMHFFDDDYEHLNLETLNILHSINSNCKRFNYVFMRHYHILYQIYMSLLYYFDYHNFISSFVPIREVIMDCRNIINKMRISTIQQIDKKEIDRLYHFQNKLLMKILEVEKYLDSENKKLKLNII